MREKYESLALKDLRAIAKIREIKGISTMSKSEIVEALLARDEEDAKAAQNEAAEKADSDAVAVSEDKPVAKESSAKKEKAQDGGASEGKKPAKVRNNTKEEKTVSADKADETDANKGINDSNHKADEANTNKEPVNEEGKAGRDKAHKSVKAPYKAAKDGENSGQASGQTSGQVSVNTNEASESLGENAATSDNSNKSDNPVGEGAAAVKEEKTLDSGIRAHGILEVMPDGYGFIRCENFLPGENDVYVAPSQIRRFNLRTGDIIEGNTRIKTMNEKFSALLYLKSVNGYDPEIIRRRTNFEDMTPIFPNSRIKLETPGTSVAMRVMDLLSPVGKGQRGMIVSPPKAGKTTLLKEVAKSVKRNHPDIHMIILLIDERPEEVTDIKEAIEGPNVEVIYSTFDELPEHHKRVSEMVIERAKRLVESHKDVMILLDSITRLTRAYNLTVPPSGRTLSGGLDPAALHMPKRFFGAARNMREGGSLTILATALVDTGSKMDDVVYEEFKGTGNMEMVLDRKLSEKRIFPAIDIPKSGTRRDDLLLTKEEIDAVNNLRRGINGLKPDECVDRILDMFSKTRCNADFINMSNKIHIF